VKVTPTALPDVRIVEPRIFRDDRGFFLESWKERVFDEAGIEGRFVQDNHSRSKKGVLRGLHYQVDQPQGKLVRVVTGRAFDVAVDLRRASPTFGHWVGVELSADAFNMLWVPPGFAHGFLSLEDGTDLLYKCTDYYAPEHERSLLWSDPAIGIAWPLDGIGAPLLSGKDAEAPLLADAETFA
jgi:dTDP-4-dehydrorhamnose 3,5-epimerase